MSSETIPATTALIAVTLSGEISFWSRDAERIFGWTEAEVTGKPVPFVPRHKRREYHRRMKKLLSGEPLRPAQLERIRKDGTPLVVTVDAFPLPGPDGEVLGIGATIAPASAGATVFPAAPVSHFSFLRKIINGVRDCIIVIGLDHRILLMNEAARELVRCEEGDYSGRTCHDLLHGRSTPCSDAGFACIIDTVRSTGKPVRVVKAKERANAERTHHEIDAFPLIGPDGALQGVIEISRDVTERIAIEKKMRENDERLSYLAFHDHLTHLANRALFQDRLHHALARARRHDHPVAVIHIDLDAFKKVNDTLGHRKGDLVLCEVARRLRLAVRESDTLARLGGDEFAVIVEAPDDIGGVVTLVNKLFQGITEPVTIDDCRFYLGGSAGIGIFPMDAQDVEGLMQAAEAAMYKAKESGGRNVYRLFSRDMNGNRRDALRLETALREAIAQERIEVHYQPIVELGSGKTVAAEALVRWRHPELGMLSPLHFIPLAEENGLIVPLGELVLRQVCRQLRAWLDSGMTPPVVAVNVSARQFRQAGLVETVAAILGESDVPPSLLELEITESAVMYDVEGAIRTMEELNAMGVRLTIDDFGTGYSSLSYLGKFPISKLKIDRSFIADIYGKRQNTAIASGIIALARSLHLKVVAEGIEKNEQLHFLAAMGCDLGQGFLFSPPRPAREWLHS